MLLNGEVKWNGWKNKSTFLYFMLEYALQNKYKMIEEQKKEEFFWYDTNIKEIVWQKQYLIIQN
jgi:hypothetical protein